MEENYKNETEERQSLNDLLGKKITTQEILSSIARWVEYHEGNVAFIGSFVTFNSNGEILENVILGHGDKETLCELVEDIVEEVEKGPDFISI